MKDCDFECYYRTEAGNCEQGGGECQEEDCVFWMDQAAVRIQTDARYNDFMN